MYNFDYTYIYFIFIFFPSDTRLNVTYEADRSSQECRGNFDIFVGILPFIVKYYGKLDIFRTYELPGHQNNPVPSFLSGENGLK